MSNTSGAAQYGGPAVTPRAIAPQWLIPALQDLARLSVLENNWDGYGSPPIWPAALASARRLVAALEGNALPISAICPVTGGGIGFTWRRDLRELEVEIFPDGVARYLTVLTDPESGEEATLDDHLSLDHADQVQRLATWLVG